MRGGYFGTRPFGVPGWHRWCSRAPSGRVAVCVRGRRPARSPSALRAFGSARRLEARPGPAAAHGHRGHALRTGGAVSLCVVARPCRRPRTPRSSPPGPLAHSAPAAPSAPVALCRCVWRSGPAAAHGHRGYALHTGGAVSLCVVARPCRRPRIPRSCPPGSAAPSAPAALCRCVWWPGPAAAQGHRGHPLRALWPTPHRRHPPHRWRCVVVCGGQALPPPTDTAAMPSTPAALCRCVWWPGPAAAHGYRGRALRALRRPPHCGLTWFRVWRPQAGGY